VDAPALSLTASFALGALFAIGVARSRFLRGITELCSAGALVFFALFLADSDIRDLVFRSVPPAFDAPRVREKMPVVVVIFDELPLSSLLDAEGQIDGHRFPSFAKLAGRSSWFRNATGVAGFTQQAVPAILTGRYPGTRPRLARSSDAVFGQVSVPVEEARSVDEPVLATVGSSRRAGRRPVAGDSWGPSPGRTTAGLPWAGRCSW